MDKVPHNPGSVTINHPPLKANGKGIGNLPGYNKAYAKAASENLNPMAKSNVTKVVGK